MTTRADENKKLIADLFQDFRTGKAFGIPQAPAGSQPVGLGELVKDRPIGHVSQPILKRCRSCADPLLDDRFDYCPKCDREARGPFSHGEGE